MNPETTLMRRIMLRASALGLRLFRRNVGTLYTHDGRPVRVGVPGESDLQGWRTITIGPEHVGQRIAQFVAVEVKTERGTLTQEQRDYLRTVEAAGGVAVVARSMPDIEKIAPPR